jgi:xanthine dehydrogenase iron-sulfur cluster and FAD-binding subunit A
MVAEEKKGRVKITLEVEINEALMEIVKDIPQMAQLWQSMREQRKSKKSE